MATINSKAWSDAPSAGAQAATETGLYWYPIEPDVFEGGPAFPRTPPHVIDAPRAAHIIPAYSR